MFVRHGWFSTECDNSVGSLEVLTIDGKIVRFTHDSREKTATNLGFDDAIYIGEIDLDTCRNLRKKTGWVPGRSTANINLCSQCNHEVKERELFLSKYIGCMC